MSFLSSELFCSTVHDKLAFAPVKALKNYWGLLSGSKARKVEKALQEAIAIRNSFPIATAADISDIRNQIAQLTNSKVQGKKAQLKELWAKHDAMVTGWTAERKAAYLEAVQRKIKDASDQALFGTLAGVGIAVPTISGAIAYKRAQDNKSPWTRLKNRFK